ncbi:hypothetical protein [Fodinicola feengrottensis]|uniref:hypothetical protein n=1 Tax=Fodinicola feengrottensis TaxID=435914 RepID=UPI0013D1F298|nr:hypothetical protein [Fodinicola feengrottensis]
MAALEQRAATVGPAELSDVVHGLADLFPVLPLDAGAELSLRCAAFVERGADPTPVAGPLLTCALRALNGCVVLDRAWLGSSPGGKRHVELPDSATSVGAIRDALTAVVGNAQAYEAAMGWHTISRWQHAVSVLLQQRAVRDQLHEQPLTRQAWMDAVDACAEFLPEVMDLSVLLAVLDDEPLMVLHRASGRGYRLRMSGIPNVFQLHTLLAARLIGTGEWGLIEDAGIGPDPLQVAAATDSPIDTDEMAGYFSSFFSLRDVHGAQIWNHSIPADIPLVHGHRVIVLDQQTNIERWDIGRRFPHMLPTLTVTRHLGPAESRRWLRYIAPAPTD